MLLLFNHHLFITVDVQKCEREKASDEQLYTV